MGDATPGWVDSEHVVKVSIRDNGDGTETGVVTSGNNKTELTAPKGKVQMFVKILSGKDAAGSITLPITRNA